MKKHILTGFLLAIAALAAQAQQRMVLVMDDGTEKTYESWQVDRIYFKDAEVKVSPKTAPVVDLGFAKWAQFNLGATRPSEAGWLVGWGDVSATNFSTKLKYFPAENYTNDIYETPYDIAQKKWGGEWRLPVEEDFQMLKDSCQWELITVDSLGYKLTSKKTGYTDKHIFLPFTGIRRGTAEVEKNTTDGFYWTGSASATAGNSRALHIYADDSILIDTIRFLQLAIRPVYGKFVHQLSVVGGEVTNLTYQSALVPLEVLGDYSTAKKIGLCFGKSTQTLNPMTATTNNSVQNIVAGNSKFNFNLTGLDGSTSYQAIGYVILEDGQYIFSDIIRFTTPAKFPVAEEVDLGLSVNWASWNMGESTPEGHSHLYGWGDPTGDLTSELASDYAVNLPYSTTTSIAGNDYFDIATRQWHNGWRLPTFEEFEELYRSTTVAKETVNGVSGYRFTSKTDATKSIFIPYTSVRFGTTIQNYNTAWYWTAEADFNAQEGWFAHMAYLIPNSVSMKRYPKWYGYGIRPVKKNYNYTGDSGTGGNTGGNSGDNTGGNTGDNTGGNTGDNTGGNTPALSNQAGVAVDLGLTSRTMWADRNVGAAKSTDVGGYFAFGDVDPHTTGYGLENYQYYDTETQKYQKIGSDVNGDWQICNNVAYDAAVKQWGGKWRMPNDLQIQELINNCTWTWKTNYGGSSMNGYEVKGPNGNTIFLPATGVTRANGCAFLGSEAYYWSGSLNTQTNDFRSAWAIWFDQDGKARMASARASGCVIRPVQPK